MGWQVLVITAVLYHHVLTLPSLLPGLRGEQDQHDFSYYSDYNDYNIMSSDEYYTESEPSLAYNFKYNEDGLRREEEQDSEGRVKGSYSYVDNLGMQTTVHYIAGAKTGFQIILPGMTNTISSFDDRTSSVEALSTSLSPSSSCPVISSLPWTSCQGSVSTCWSPGHPDTDCHNDSLCCFDGCSNTCLIDDQHPYESKDDITSTTLANEYSWKPSKTSDDQLWMTNTISSLQPSATTSLSSSCPVISSLPWTSCQGTVSTCWSPGHPDTDCHNYSLCCFDGCSNTCLIDDQHPYEIKDDITSMGNEYPLNRDDQQIVTPLLGLYSAPPPPQNEATLDDILDLPQLRMAPMDASFSFAVKEPDFTFIESADEVGERRGSYSYLDPEGELVEVNYTAGKNGFVILNSL